MGILGALVIELGLITYRGIECAGGPQWPPPADYAGAIGVYGVLGIAAKTRAGPVATAVAWGFVVATALNLWTPQHPISVGKKAPAKPAAVKG